MPRVQQPQEPDFQINQEEFVEHIKKVAAALDELHRGPLNEKAMYLLIQHAMPAKDRLSLKQIKNVFHTVMQLEKVYVDAPKA